MCDLETGGNKACTGFCYDIAAEITGITISTVSDISLISEKRILLYNGLY
jgi:hypothetical protein